MKYIIIPSCDVNKNNLDGTSTELRLKKGLQLWSGGQFDKILVSGAICYASTGQSTPAGELMRRWLKSRKVPDDKILCNNRAHNTYQDIMFSLDLLKDDLDKEITVVSHWQHTLRFWITFKRAYKINIKIVPMFYWVNLHTFFQEWLFLIIHVIDTDGTGHIVTLYRKIQKLYSR